MFAVRDKRTGKFLRSFSASLNMFTFSVGCCFNKSVRKFFGLLPWNRDDKKDPPPLTRDQVHSYMYALPSPEGAKLYKSHAAVKNSFYSYCHRGYKEHTTKNGRVINKPISIPLEEALPWIELVEVSVGISYMDPSGDWNKKY